MPELHTSSTLPPVLRKKMSPDVAKCLLGAKSLPVLNHCPKGSLVSITNPCYRKLQISDYPAKQRHNLFWILLPGPQAAFQQSPTAYCQVVWLLIIPGGPSQFHHLLLWSLPANLSQLWPTPSCSILPLMIQYHTVVVHDWLQSKVYTYLILYCPVIHYEWANIDIACMKCQGCAGAVGCRRYKDMIFTFE